MKFIIVMSAYLAVVSAGLTNLIGSNREYLPTKLDVNVASIASSLPTQVLQTAVSPVAHQVSHTNQYAVNSIVPNTVYTAQAPIYRAQEAIYSTPTVAASTAPASLYYTRIAAPEPVYTTRVYSRPSPVVYTTQGRVYAQPAPVYTQTRILARPAPVYRTYVSAPIYQRSAYTRVLSAPVYTSPAVSYTAPAASVLSYSSPTSVYRTASSVVEAQSPVYNTQPGHILASDGYHYSSPYSSLDLWAKRR